MKTVIKNIIFLGVISTVFFACDEIEGPFIENQGECGDASLPVPIKQILVEEFTGHKCGNCPDGDATMEMLKELYCDHIIPVSIHAGSFASINTSGEYTYDFRTEDGNSLKEYFEPSGYPSALINRKEIDGTLTFDRASWATEIADMLKEKPVIDINISSSFNFDSRDLDIDIDVFFIDEMNDNLMLSVYFVEDSIVSWQKDYDDTLENENIEFYAHNHVLRAAINGVWGDQILNGQANANDIKSKSYNYKINQDWVIANSNIVAFVYKNDTKEVLQASQTYLVP